MPKTSPPYPAEFRQQIIELGQAGRTPAEPSREFAPSDQTLHNWIAQAGRDRGKPLPSKAGRPRRATEQVLVSGKMPSQE